MKKLIALTVLLSVVALGVATENYEAMALGLLAPMPFLFLLLLYCSRLQR